MKIENKTAFNSTIQTRLCFDVIILYSKSKEKFLTQKINDFSELIF